MCDGCPWKYGMHAHFRSMKMNWKGACVTDFCNTHTWTCESCLAYLKDSLQPPYDYKGTLRGLLESFVSVHNNTVEEKKRFVVGNVTVTDNNDYVSYSSIDFTVTLDAIRDKLIKTHGGFLRVRYAGGVKY